MIEIPKLNTFCRINDMVFKECGEGKDEDSVYVFLNHENKQVRFTQREIVERVDSTFKGIKR